jgi:parallel beta-helix repeat protein
MYNNYIGAIFQGVSNPSFRYNTIGSSELVPLAMSFEANPVFLDNVFSFSDNEYDAIGLLHGTLSADATLIQRHVTTIDNVTYMMLGTLTIPEPYTLTVEDSIVIKGFRSSHRIIVQGGLILDGTSGDGQIVITSAKDDNHGNPMDSNKDGTQTTPVIGDWGGIIFEGTADDARCLLNHCLLKYGSKPSSWYHTRYISQGLVTTVNASPTLNHCTIKDMHFGLYAFQASDPVVNYCEFTNSTKTPVAMSVSADPVMNGLSFVNTGWTALGIIGEKVGFDGTVRIRNVAGYNNITYLLLEDLTINSGTYVDVDPGVVFKCARNAGIFADGGFQAVGTPADTITFTSVADDNYGNPQDTENDGDATAPKPGDWHTIQYRATADDTYDSLDYCRILYAGYYNKGSLIFTDAGGTVTHTLISDGHYYGIMCEGTASPKCTDGVEIRNCVRDPLAMSLKSNPDFSFAGMTLEANGNGSNGIRILEGTLSSDATLETRDVAGIYNIAYIVDRLTVSPDATLTIMPGVVIKFLNYNSYISVQGALIADGTVGGPYKSEALRDKIVFTSLKDDSKGGDTNDDGNTTAPQRGDWWCITFGSSERDHLNVLDNCIIHYGARDQSGYPNRKDFGAVRVFDASVVIDSCAIEQCHTSALGIFGSADPVVSNNEIHNVNQTPVTMSMFSNPVFSGNQASNLGIRAIGIAEESFSLDATVPIRDFAGFDSITYYLYRPLKVNSGTTITIPAGVVFKFNHNIDCFDVDGGLIINGTAAEPVVFTHESDDDFGRPMDTNEDGADSKPTIQNYTYCLDFADISNDSSSINHTVFRYKQAGINLRQASPSIDNCEFKYNNYGVILDGVSNPDVTNNTFDELVYSPLLISLVSYPATASGNQILGSTYRAMGILSEELVQDVTLINRTFAGIDSIPYFFSGNYSIGTSVVLTVEPGVIMKFHPYAKLTVKRGLIALGGSSPDSIIVFTSIFDDFYGGDTNADSTETAPGNRENWRGIHFEDQSLDALCRLRHCIIQYAGWNANDAAITTVAASPTITHSVIAHNKNGVRATGASNPRLDSCDIYNNTDFGVNNVNKSFDISALGCWWGTSDGPTHSSNPGGTGDVISDRVLYSPFRTVPQNPIMGDVSLNGLIQAYDASLILQHVVSNFLSAEQLEVADVSGDGNVTAYDASLILQYVSGIIQEFPVNATKSYGPAATLHLEGARVNSGDRFAVPLRAENLYGITALEITLKYDPELIRIEAVTLSGKLSGYMANQHIDHELGLVKLALAGVDDLPGNCDLGYLDCRVNKDYTGSTLTMVGIDRFLANETNFTAVSVPAEIWVNMVTGTDPHMVMAPGFTRIYPNPFHDIILVEYHVASDNQPVALEVFDPAGRKIRTLVNEHAGQGSYRVEWRPESETERLMEGLYILRLSTGDQLFQEKIMYVK